MTTQELQTFISEIVEIELELPMFFNYISCSVVEYRLLHASVTEHGKFRKINIVGDLNGKKHDLYILDDEHAPAKIRQFFEFTLVRDDNERI